MGPLLPSTMLGSTSSPRTGARRIRSRSRSTISPCRTFRARGSEASAQSGHDLFGFNGAGGAHLHRKFYRRCRSREGNRGKVRQGIHHRQATGYNADDGTWSAFPIFTSFPGVSKEPVGRDRRSAGHLGQLAHRWRQAERKANPSASRSGTATTRARPGAACCGATAPPSGIARQKIVLNSKEAVETVKPLPRSTRKQ